MPNWCENDLNIRGENVANVLSAIRSDASGSIDFDLIIPCPPELHITSGGDNDIGLLCLGWAKQPDQNAAGGLGSYATYPWVLNNNIRNPRELCAYRKLDFEEMVKLGQVIQSNCEKHGAPTWHEWNIEHWGTKWNASDATVTMQNNSEAEISFNTAWSPALPIIAALSQKFPDYVFTLRYYEGGMGFQGIEEVKAGEVRQSECTDYSGHRGG